MTMDTITVLIQYRPRDPSCQAFDHYLVLPSNYTRGDIFNAAVDDLYDYYTNNVTSGDFRRRVCDPTEYDIEIGPTLAEIA